VVTLNRHPIWSELTETKIFNHTSSGISPAGKAFREEKPQQAICNSRGDIMKLVYVGLILLWTMTLVFASTETRSTEPSSTQATHQSEQVSVEQVTVPLPTQSDNSIAVFSQVEAEALTVQGDSLLAQEGIGEIRVGSVGSSDLVYILVVVLIVVLVISVVH
jgi:hypothetical protein